MRNSFKSWKRSLLLPRHAVYFWTKLGLSPECFILRPSWLYKARRSPIGTSACDISRIFAFVSSVIGDTLGSIESPIYSLNLWCCTQDWWTWEGVGIAYPRCPKDTATFSCSDKLCRLYRTHQVPGPIYILSTREWKTKVVIENALNIRPCTSTGDPSPASSEDIRSSKKSCIQWWNTPPCSNRVTLTVENDLASLSPKKHFLKTRGL